MASRPAGTATDTRAAQLSRDEIVAAAIRIVRAGGLKGLTMARVADDLGVTPAALYYYVPDKPALADLTVEAILDSLQSPVLADGPWDQRLRAWASGYFSVVSEYRGLGLQLASNTRSVAALKLTNLCVELLLEAGFTRDEAMNAQAPLRWYVFGETHADAVEGRRSRFQESVDLRAHHPKLADLSEELNDLDPYAVFMHGIELFIAGFNVELNAKKNLNGS